MVLGASRADAHSLTLDPDTDDFMFFMGAALKSVAAAVRLGANMVTDFQIPDGLSPVDYPLLLDTSPKYVAACLRAYAGHRRRIGRACDPERKKASRKSSKQRKDPTDETEKRGYQAYLDGVALVKCPYTGPSGGHRNAWLRGWQQAQSDLKGR